VRRILCVRLDNLGDVLMTTPALAALKAWRPAPHLTLLTSPAGAAVAPLVPAVDQVIAHAVPWMKASGRPDPAADHALVERLAAGGYDAAIVFTVFSQSALPAALLCHLAGIPRRLAHCRENPYGLLTDWVPEREPELGVRHEVERQLALVAAVGARAADTRLALSVPAAASRSARALLRAAGVRLEAPWLAIHPGASAPSRRYPPEGFAAAARTLAGRGWQVVFVGSAEETGLVEGIRRTMAVASHALPGRLGLAELAAVLSAAPMLVANNSGPAHVAAAVGTPVVDLYALTNPQHTPWGVPHRVLNRDVPCRDCFKSVCPAGHHACLRGVSPDEIVSAVEELAAETGRLRPHPVAARADQLGAPAPGRSSA
jgi:lipopolysaccharide heptosyltransferase II